MADICGACLEEGARMPRMAAAIKRYLLFVYPRYYPAAGWHDLEGSFDSIEEALTFRAAMDSISQDYLHHVVDIESGKVVHGETEGA